MTHSGALHLIRPGVPPNEAPAIQVTALHVWFGEAHVLRGINATFHKNQINGIIGPSGSGKSTLIRSINRMNDTVDGCVYTGAIAVHDGHIFDAAVDVARLRTRVGMVFQKPCVFPKSIADNVLFGLQHLRKRSRQARQQLVEDNLRAVSLWQEVRHRLHDPASSLSVGQQQRLCIARTLAVQPEILLLDEPTSSLDPVSARAIEALLEELKKAYTIVLVTHNIQQAHRLTDRLLFLCDGAVIEQGPTEQLFCHPEQAQTRRYLTDEFCDC